MKWWKIHTYETEFVLEFTLSHLERQVRRDSPSPAYQGQKVTLEPPWQSRGSTYRSFPKITTCSCVPSCPTDIAFSYLLAERLQPWDRSFCLFSLPLAQKPHVKDVGFMSGCWYTPFLWRTSSLYVINLKTDDFVDQESTRNKNVAAAQ